MRLRFYLCGNYSHIFNSISQINSLDWFGQCLQQQLNLYRGSCGTFLGDEKLNKFVSASIK
jgi:hypothetical protein